MNDKISTRLLLEYSAKGILAIYDSVSFQDMKYSTSLFLLKDSMSALGETMDPNVRNLVQRWMKEYEDFRNG